MKLETPSGRRHEPARGLFGSERANSLELASAARVGTTGLPCFARNLRRRENRRVMALLRDRAGVLVERFALRYKSISAEREGITSHYGICYEDGVIRIRLRHARTGRLLKESSLIDTLCHELAHLRYLDHSERFQRLYERILDTARELGYYRPGPGQRRPVQLTLFGGGCGTVARKR
jgi:hypothetical protein